MGVEDFRVTKIVVTTFLAQMDFIGFIILDYLCYGVIQKEIKRKRN
jgi:hypothetical protein